MNVLFLENDDSYSWNVVDLLRGCGAEVTVAPGHDLQSVRLLSQSVRSPDRRHDAVVLGPGPLDPRRAGLLETVAAIVQAQLPLLGICLGHQAIGMHFGAQLIRVPPAHGIISTIRFRESRFFKSIDAPAPVMRYHSLAIAELNSPLRAVAETKDGIVMALEHQSLPIAGLQFHPDSFATPRGAEMVASFLQAAR